MKAPRNDRRWDGHHRARAHAHGAVRGRMLALLGLVALAASLFALQARPQRAWAQETGPNAATTLFAGSVENEAFPTVEVVVYAVDGDGLPLNELGSSDLLITEDGNELAVDTVTVTPDTEEPLNLVIALNRATPAVDWATVVEATTGLLDQLGPEDRVGLVAYNEEAETLIAPTQDIDAVRAALASAQPGGVQSALYAAINQSLGLYEDVSGRRALVVVSDRGNTAAAGGDETVLPALVEVARKEGVSGNAIGFGPAGANPDFLTLATGTGGRAIAVSSAGDVAPHMQAMPALLRPGFRISYDSAIPATNDGHLLSLALRGAGG